MWWLAYKTELLDRAMSYVSHSTATTAPRLSLVKEKITIHPVILDMAYRIWAKRDFQGFPPSPQELMAVDLEFYNQVLIYAEIVDYAKGILSKDNF